MKTEPSGRGGRIDDRVGFGYGGGGEMNPYAFQNESPNELNPEASSLLVKQFERKFTPDKDEGKGSQSDRQGDVDRELDHEESSNIRGPPGRNLHTLFL